MKINKNETSTETHNVALVKFYEKFMKADLDHTGITPPHRALWILRTDIKYYNCITEALTSAQNYKQWSGSCSCNLYYLIKQKVYPPPLDSIVTFRYVFNLLCNKQNPIPKIQSLILLYWACTCRTHNILSNIFVNFVAATFLRSSSSFSKLSRCCSELPCTNQIMSSANWKRRVLKANSVLSRLLLTYGERTLSW